MSDSYVQVAVDGSGKKMQTYENTISAQTVEAEAIVVVDATGNPITTREIQDTPVNTDTGILTHAVVYGHTTAGGGAYVEVKVAPSGALQVDGSGTTQPVSISATVTTKETRSATATTTQVADTNVNATLLALNANRLGATIENDSSAVLYVKLGTTATATDYTVRLVQFAYYELPFGYTGRIDGIWASDPNDGAARITELT